MSRRNSGLSVVVDEPSQRWLSGVVDEPLQHRSVVGKDLAFQLQLMVGNHNR